MLAAKRIMLATLKGIKVDMFLGSLDLKDTTMW